VFDQASDFLSKIKYGKIAATVRTTWIPVWTRYSLRQVRNSNLTVWTPAYHGSNACMIDMEIACSRSPVRTSIPMVRTRDTLVRKLLAADVRPSGRQCLTVWTRLSNRKDFSENLEILVEQLSVRTTHDHRLNGAQLYQARHSFESSAYK
jgi:hypothetical protein